MTQLRVAPATVVAWLADGSLQQVGTVPSASTGGDAVYSVESENLLHELQLKQVEASPLDLAPWREAAVWQESTQPGSSVAAEESTAESSEEPASDDEEYVDGSELDALIDSWGDDAAVEAPDQANASAASEARQATETVMAEEQPEAGNVDAVAAEPLAVATAVEVELVAQAEPSDDVQVPEETTSTNADAAASVCEVDTAELALEHSAVAEPLADEASAAMDSSTAEEVVEEPRTVAEALDALFGEAPRIGESASGSIGAPEAAVDEFVDEAAPPEIDSFAAEPALTADEEVLADSVNEFTDDLAADLEVEAPDLVLAAATPIDERIAELRNYVGAEPELEPIVTALRDGFEQTRRGLAETTACLQSIAQHLQAQGPMRPVRVVMNGVAATNALAAPQAKPAGIGNAALITSTLLILGWAGVLWWKTGDLRLALGAVAAANVLACCAVLGRRS